MPRGKDAVLLSLNDFTGGESFIHPHINMPLKYASLLKNCLVSEKGGIAKVPGYQRVNIGTVSLPITSGYDFRKTDGTVIRLVAGGGKIWKVSGGNSLSEIKTGLDTSAKVSFATISDLCIMCNGVDAVMKYDGTTVSALGGSPPAGAHKVHVHKGRVWLLEKDKMKASFSTLNTPEEWTGGSSGSIEFKYILKEGDPLYDTNTFVDLQVFFFGDHIALYSGSDPTGSGDYALAQLIKGSGVVAPDANINLGTDMAFLHGSGVKSLRQVVTTGQLNIDNISQTIDPMLRRLVNQNVSGNYGTAHYPKMGLFMLLVDDRILLYDYNRKAWSRIEDADVYGIFSNITGDVYFTGYGYLYRFDSGWSFDGNDITMEWRKGWVRVSRQGRYFYPKFAELINGQGPVSTILMTTRFDSSTSIVGNSYSLDTNIVPVLMDEMPPAIWENCFYMDAEPYIPVRIPLFGRGKSMEISFTNISSDGPIEINDIAIQGTLGGL